MADKKHPTHEITDLLHAWNEGESEALDELLPIVYEELHRQAENFMRRERPNHTLRTTALIHEAYLKLVDQNHMEWKNRSQFFGIAANLMRRVLIDYARTRKRQKRGGREEDLPLREDLIVATKERNINVLALDEALNQLSEMDERQGRIVELRYFGGLSIKETAKVLDVSVATVKRDWSMAKAWLHRQITK